MTWPPRWLLLVSLLSTTGPSVQAQDLPAHLPEIRFHLTARPWQPLGITSETYLDTIEASCRAATRHQDQRGAIIDPFLKREHQYATPYFAFAVATLLHAGRASDLRDAGLRAMEHATAAFARGSDGIPDAHGEFFIAPLTDALALYRDYVPPQTYARWEARLRTPLAEVMRDSTGRINNWRTYAMKGEWLRAKAGLVSPASARAFIEQAWTRQTQRERIVSDKWNLYQDWSSDPQSHAVEAVGRGNLTALVVAGYDGPSADEMRRAIRRGTQTALLLQSPDGQCPPNGRTDNHVFNDVLYGLGFEMMAEAAWRQGDRHLAGQYRHAALLSFHSIDRWRRRDPPWEGSFFVTKNFFDPARRIGYQPASQWSTYNGAVMLHLAEAYLAREHEIEEQPAPTEIGGYALSTDARFSSFVANAGGMQVFANLRGASIAKYGRSWTPLGVVRLTRAGWDGRLGPSDGEHDPEAGRSRGLIGMVGRLVGKNRYDYKPQSGVTFAPTWKELGRWVRMADRHRHYRATPYVAFVHPLLVRFSLTYHDVTGQGGPSFRHEFVITPDGVLTRLTSLQAQPLAVTVPLLEDDGRRLKTTVTASMARTAYAEGGDEQYFISLNPEATLEIEGPSIQSTYGWLQPVRIRAASDTNVVFIYPRSPGDPPGEEVRQSFTFEEAGFSSILGRVEDNLYVGRTAAGGEGDRVDLDDDGEADVVFSAPCQFILQLQEGQVVAAEADEAVTMAYHGRRIALQAYQPVALRP